MPTMCDVKPGLTNRFGRPVVGCTRTTGWITGGTFAASSRSCCASARSSAESNGSPQYASGEMRCTASSSSTIFCSGGGESLVRGARVGEHRVAARHRRRVADQHRRCRRSRDERDVGVPARVAATLRTILLEDLGEVGMAGDHRMRRRRFAERPRQLHLLAMRQVLVAEHQQPMILEQRREPRRIDAVTGMTAHELGAEHAGDRA